MVGCWSLAPSRRENVGYAEINKGFKGIMNFRVLAASAQAPQRSNGNDFLPHNAPRLEKGGGVEREGALLKEDGGAVDQPWVEGGGAFVLQGCTPPRTHAFAFFSLSLSLFPSMF